MADIRIILDGDIEPEDVKAALAKLDFTVEEEFAASEESPLEIRFRHADGGKIRFTEDPFIFVRYLDVAADVPGAVVARVRLALPYMPADEIMRGARAEGSSAQERVDWMMSAAALESGADRSELIALISERLKDDVPAVRLAALRAAGWLAWPEFKPLVRPLIEDEDDDVSGFARDIATGFDRA